MSNAEQIAAVEKVTNEIVRDEIRLVRFSTQFYAAWLKPERFKSWRLFAYKMAGSGLTNAGMIAIAGSRFQYRSNPSEAPRKYLKSGHIINLTAASILLAGTLTELFLDRLSERSLSRQHLDPASAVKEFLTVRNKLDALIGSRKDILKNCSELTLRQREILEADGQVLQDIRDLACAEFHHAYCDIARLRGTRDIANATTLFSAGTAGYGGSLNSLLSVANKLPRQTGVAGIGFMTSGASVAVSPLIINWGSHFAGKRAAAKIEEAGILEQDADKDYFIVTKKIEY
ncbi:MAG: hypothetical protein K2X27_19090, partial [Candidatus Obscuribacterales bacterium]|nr:hypothetical protein [Candidatus Obscuribacterales bacterium]